MSRTSIELNPLPSSIPTVGIAVESTEPSVPADKEDMSLPIQSCSSNDEAAAVQASITAKGRTAIIISSVTIITAIDTFLYGMVTVGLPVIARDLKLGADLLLWCVLSSILYLSGSQVVGMGLRIQKISRHCHSGTAFSQWQECRTNFASSIGPSQFVLSPVDARFCCSAQSPTL